MRCSATFMSTRLTTRTSVETNQETNKSILSTRDGRNSMKLCTANVFNMQKASSRLPTFVCTQLLMRWTSSCNLDLLGGKSASALVRGESKIMVAPNTALHRNASSIEIALKERAAEGACTHILVVIQFNQLEFYLCQENNFAIRLKWGLHGSNKFPASYPLREIYRLIF